MGLATTVDVKRGAHADFALRVTHEGLADAALANDAGRAVYRDVAASTDLLVSAGDSQAEWFYVLRDAKAPARFAMHVDLGRGLTKVVTKHDGSLAFQDARGKTRLAIPKAHAIDARGVKRDVTLAWKDDARGVGERAGERVSGRLDVSLDARGLAYPVVVDPSVAMPLWEEVNAGSSAGVPARTAASMAYDSARGKTVLFGGNNSLSYPYNRSFNDTWERDGTTWMELASANAPGGGGGPMAYDSARAKTVLFGGAAGNETWEWDGTNWTRRTSTNAPSDRLQASIAYDSSRAKIVLFGGNGASGSLNDTWEWDGTNWTAHTSTSVPPVRYASSVAYDSARGKIVLFGGVNDFSTLNDTWEWDGTNWTEPTTMNAPAVRANASMAYDSARGKTVLFGGSGNSDGTNVLNDTWEWDGTNWTQRTSTSAPSARGGAAIAYDSARGKMVLFGGTSDGSTLNDTWEWDGTNWTEPTTTSAPPARYNAAMTYDSARAMTVLFGGNGNSGLLNDTWEWDDTTWTQRTPTNAPASREFAAMAYDSARGKTVLFGGVTDTSNFLLSNDTWGWDGTNWTLRTSPSAPSARGGAAMAYDSARGKIVLFGGFGSVQTDDGAFISFNDTWEWDGTNWTERTSTDAPSMRAGAAMAYDSARNETVLFGGGDYFYRGSNYVNNTNDTWEWDGTNWTQRTPTNPPSARASASMAYDSTREKTVLFGGGTNDTWEWDGTNWNELSLSSPPDRNFATMAFDAQHGVVLFGGNGVIPLGGSGNAGPLNDTWLYVTIAGACTTTATCDSGSCVDGVCCAQSSCGACQSCAVPGSEGQCTNVAAGTVPTTGDANACAAPNECTASGICAFPQGAACTNAADCVSGFCVDGVCCDSACTGDCQACGAARGLSENGTCSLALEGTPGRTACASDFACNGKEPTCPTTCADDASCAAGFYCNAAGVCAAQKTQGASCSTNAGADCLTRDCRECAPVGDASTGQCVDNVCCDTPCDGACATCNAINAVGTCTNAAAGTPGGVDGRPLCAPYTCTGTSAACGTTCTTNADCATQAYCESTSHTCQGTATLGSACSADDACASDHCITGLCCSSTCGAPSDSGASICDVGICNASTGFACQLPGATVQCRTTSCVDAKLTFAASCNGNGGCGAVESLACPDGLACNAAGTNCNTVCASDSDCQTAKNYHCDTSSNTCVQAASCSADAKSVVSSNGATSACAPYFCAADKCATTCTSVTDCQMGFLCDATNHCTASASTDGVASSSGGCGCRTGRSTETRAPWGLLVVALAVARGRTRRTRSRGWTRPHAWIRRALVWLASLLALATFVACDSHGASHDASGIALSAAMQDATMATSLAGSRFVEDGRGGLVAHAWRDATKPQGLTFGARLPASAGGAIDVGLATTTDVKRGAPPDFALRVTHERLADAPLTNDAGRAIYRDVAASTDLLVSATDAQAEWFYVLRDAHAPTTFAMRVALGNGLTKVVTKHDGSLAFQDARGTTRLAMPAAYAVDARGVKRDVTLMWKDDAGARAGRLEVQLDAHGLAFPVVVDPSIAIPLWEEVNTRTASSAPAEGGGPMAYDSARAKTVLFGGAAGNETWEWDGTRWTQRASTRSPGAGGPFASAPGPIAYDSARGKTVLFGGSAGNETWEWDGTNWTQRTTTNPPPIRYGASMAYDSTRARTVLFGGVGTDGYLNDTWEWDGTNWTQRISTIVPPVRVLSAMAYDSTRGKTVLFGGNFGGNDTWEWDGINWTEIATATFPGGGPMAYDSARGKTVLFGGNAGNETWEWDGTNWTQQTPTNAPPARGGASLAYDSARGETVLFGGNAGNETWEWDGTNWTARATTNAPPARSGASMSYDTLRGRSVLFGGIDNNATFLSDTWEWDGTNWTQRTPITAPVSREFTAMAYDSARGKTVLFGGYIGDIRDFFLSNETWEWDGTNWTQQTPTNAPDERDGMSMAYDSARGKTVLFGGYNSSSGYLGDTWEWDGTNWTERTTTNAPPPRSGATMAYDSIRGKNVLFGGSVGYYDYVNDTWEWDGTNWTQRTSTNVPPSQGQSAMAYDSTRGKTVLFGSNDTWEWDGTDWTQPSLSSPPGRDYPSMAFDTRHGVVLFGGTGYTGALNDTWLYITIAGACTTTATCDSGNCVDGVCCAQSSCGTCQSCAVPGSEGQCTNVPVGTVPTTGDPNACAAPNECTASGACALPQGATCTNASDCFTNFCVDGVCCDSACTDDCQACGTSRGLSENGTCSLALEGTAGRTACANDFACNGKEATCPTTCTHDASCAAGYYCNAAGACVAQKQQGASCSTTPGTDCLTAGCRECAPVGDASTGQCVDNVCCDTPCDGACATCNASGALGTCTNAAAGTSGGVDGRPLCAPYTCSGTSSACATTCTTNADCATQAYCDSASHMCQGTATLGTACSADDACASDHCVGGLCCSSTCGAATDSGASVCNVGICNASTGFACQLPGATVQCRTTSCVDANLTFAASCDGNGACGAVESLACPDGLTCNAAGTNCNTACASDSDCQTAKNYHCDSASMTCVQGASCSADAKSAVSSNGATTACAPYFCAGNKCSTSCASVTDCQAGFVCDATGTCTASSSTVAAPSSGCGCRTARTGPTHAPWGFVVAALAIARARTRRARSHLSPRRA